MLARLTPPRSHLLDQLTPEEEDELCTVTEHHCKRRRTTAIAQRTTRGQPLLVIDLTAPTVPVSLTTSLFATSSPASSRAQLTTVVRLKRKRSVVTQGCDVYIGRACCRGGWNLPQSKWHNPYSVRECGGSAAVAVARFEQHLLRNEQLMGDLHELKGKVLGCWCKERGTEPCHGDVLAKWANVSER
jgi:hypothetical protein